MLKHIIGTYFATKLLAYGFLLKYKKYMNEAGYSEYVYSKKDITIGKKIKTEGILLLPYVNLVFLIAGLIVQEKEIKEKGIETLANDFNLVSYKEIIESFENRLVLRNALIDDMIIEGLDQTEIMNMLDDIEKNDPLMKAAFETSPEKLAELYAKGIVYSCFPDDMINPLSRKELQKLITKNNINISINKFNNSSNLALEKVLLNAGIIDRTSVQIKKDNNYIFDQLVENIKTLALKYPEASSYNNLIFIQALNKTFIDEKEDIKKPMVITNKK